MPPVLRLPGMVCRPWWGFIRKGFCFPPLAAVGQILSPAGVGFARERLDGTLG
jgi:hypothetical protein